jgi:hypothetical protein
MDNSLFMHIPKSLYNEMKVPGILGDVHGELSYLEQLHSHVK